MSGEGGTGAAALRGPGGSQSPGHAWDAPPGPVPWSCHKGARVLSGGTGRFTGSDLQLGFLPVLGWTPLAVTERGNPADRGDPALRSHAPPARPAQAVCTGGTEGTRMSTAVRVCLPPRASGEPARLVSGLLPRWGHLVGAQGLERLRVFHNGTPLSNGHNQGKAKDRLSRGTWLGGQQWRLWPGGSGSGTSQHLPAQVACSLLLARLLTRGRAQGLRS